MNEIIAVFGIGTIIITKRIIHTTTKRRVFNGNGLVSNIRTNASMFYGRHDSCGDGYLFKNYDGIISTKWVADDYTGPLNRKTDNAVIIQANTEKTSIYKTFKEPFDMLKIPPLPFVRNCWVIYDQQCHWKGDWVSTGPGAGYIVHKEKRVVYDFYEMWYTNKDDKEYYRQIKELLEINLVNCIANIVMDYLMIIPVVGNKFFSDGNGCEMNYHRRFSS